jgi:hypothetical protein
MKKSDLKEYIKDRIRKAVEEASIVDPNTPSSKAPEIAQREKISLPTVNAAINQARTSRKPITIGETEIEELARPAENFTIAPDFRERAAEIRTGGPVSPAKLNNALDFLEGKDQITGPQLAAGLGYVDANEKPLMPRIYPIWAALISVGAITPTAAPVAPEEDVEDVEVDAEEVPIAEPEAEVEPEPAEAELEKTTITMDPIAQAASNFTTDNTSLIQSIISSYKSSRMRLGEVRDDKEDLSADDFKKALQQSKEESISRLARKVDELVKKIKELEPDVQDKVLTILDFRFKSVDAAGLSKLISRMLGKQIESTPVQKTTDLDIEDVDDEELMEDSGVEDVSYEPTFKDYENIYERMRKLVNYKG